MKWDYEQKKNFFVLLISLHHCLCKIAAMKRNMTCYSETSQDFGLKNISPSKLFR